MYVSFDILCVCVCVCLYICNHSYSAAEFAGHTALSISLGGYRTQLRSALPAMAMVSANGTARPMAVSALNTSGYIGQVTNSRK